MPSEMGNRTIQIAQIEGKESEYPRYLTIFINIYTVYGIYRIIQTIIISREGDRERDRARETERETKSLSLFGHIHKCNIFIHREK